MNTHYISTEKLTFRKLYQIVNENYQISLSDESKGLIIKCREYLDKKMDSQTEPIYGITTGFGSLCNVSISKNNLDNFKLT